MQRARRFALFAFVAVAGAALLTGCGRAEPGVAAYVGDKQFTTDEVDGIVAEANREATSPIRATADAVVQLLVMNEVAGRLITEKNLKPQDVPADAIAEAILMRADSRFVQLWTSVISKQYALEQATTPAKLTDDDLMRYYNAGVQGGAFRPGVALDDVRQALTADERIARLFAVHNEVGAALKSADVVVNPRYGPPAQPILIPNQNGTADKLTLTFDADADPAVSA